MKVKQLIRMLKKMDPERFVVMAADSEGNRYRLLAEAGPAPYSLSRNEPYAETGNVVASVVLWPQH